MKSEQFKREKKVHKPPDFFLLVSVVREIKFQL